LADKSTQLVLDALGRAVADPGGLALHGSRTQPGLFARTAAARQAAQRCKDEGYLRIVRTEARGKAVQEICAITEKGVAHLLSQVSPRQVLEDFIRALESRRAQVAELHEAVRRWQAGFDGLRASAEKVLQQIPKPSVPAVPVPGSNGSETWVTTVLDHLTAWKNSGVSEDCPLPDLFRRAQQAYAALTIGHFHDSLRRLHDEGHIYLHPWTGPLYEIPEPPYALLVGHEIAYYASRR
jgi:hypothetical protein